MKTELQIKVSGSGTKKDIIEALKDLAESISQQSDEILLGGTELEDSVLITEISEA